MKLLECLRTREDIEGDISRWAEIKVNRMPLDVHSVVTNPMRETKHFVLGLTAAKGTKIWELWFTEKELEQITSDFAMLKAAKKEEKGKKK